MKNSDNGGELVRGDFREVVTTGGHRVVFPTLSVMPRENTFRGKPSTEKLGYGGRAHQRLSITCSHRSSVTDQPSESWVWKPCPGHGILGNENALVPRSTSRINDKSNPLQSTCVGDDYKCASTNTKNTNVSTILGPLISVQNGAAISYIQDFTSRKTSLFLPDRLFNMRGCPKERPSLTLHDVYSD